MRTLPAAVRGSASATTTLVGTLCAASPAEDARRAELLDRRGSVALSRHHHGAHRLPPRLVGRGAHRHFGDRTVTGQHLFDLAGRDVLSAPDDDVLRPVCHHEVPVLVEAGQVTGAEPRGLDERFGVGRRVLVAEELLRAPGHDLPLLARRHVAAVVIEQSDLVARGHPPVGAAAACRAGRPDPPELMAGCSVDPYVRQVTMPGRLAAVRPARAAPPPRRRGSGRATRCHARQRSCLVEQGGEEEGRARAGGDAVLLDELGRGPSAPAVHHDRRPAGDQRSQEAEERGHVAGRKRGEHPAGRVGGHGDETGQQRLVAVLHALRRRRGARRVEHAGDRGRVGRDGHGTTENRVRYCSSATWPGASVSRRGRSRVAVAGRSPRPGADAGRARAIRARRLHAARTGLGHGMGDLVRGRGGRDRDGDGVRAARRRRGPRYPSDRPGPAQRPCPRLRRSRRSQPRRARRWRVPATRRASPLSSPRRPGRRGCGRRHGTRSRPRSPRRR